MAVSDAPRGAVNLDMDFRVDGGWWQRLHHAVLPPHCLLCGLSGATGRDLCAGCARDLVRNHCCCPRCALPLAAPAPLCGECLQREPAFAGESRTSATDLPRLRETV